MREWMQALLERSISAGWLVLAVVVLRLILRRAPKWTAPLLWGLVGVRLVMPFSIQSPWSLVPPSGLGTAVPTPPAPVTAPVPAVPWSPSETPVNTVTQLPPDTSALQDTWAVFMVVWVIGAAVMLLYALVSAVILRRRLRTAVLLEKNLYETEQPGAPFVMGLFRPRIYLPFGLPETERRYVLLHERAHLRRGDPWWKLLAFLLLSVYWFHPLLWLAYVLLGRDLELACDERAVRELSMEARADYSQSLLHCSVPRRYLAACPLAFGEVGVKTRVKNVLNSRKPAFYVVLAALLLCILAAVCFLTDPPCPRAILANGRLYYDTELIFDQLPNGAVEIGMLKSTTHRDRALPTEEFCGSNLEEGYPGCDLYQCPDAPATIYLKAQDGQILSFQAEEVLLDGIVYQDLPAGEERTGDRYLRLLADGTDVRIQTTWTPAGMEVRFGLRSADGTDYAETARGGSGETVLRNLPKGTYQMFVQNLSAHGMNPGDVGVFNLCAARPAAWTAAWSAPVEKWVDLRETPDLETAVNTTFATGLTLEWTRERVTLKDESTGKTSELYSGMPVWDVYLTDLSGDGVEEICSTVSWGSGLIDSRVEVYDRAAGVCHELADRGNRDFSLELRDGALLVRETENQKTTLHKVHLREGQLLLEPIGPASEDSDICQLPLAEDANPVGDLLRTICSSPVEASSTAAYIQAHQAEYDRLVALEQETLRYCFREFLAGQGQGLRGAVMECACQEIMVSWGMKQEDVECPYGGAEEWFYLMAHCASMARLECTPQELKETSPAWYLLLEAAEGEVRDLTPYHVNRALYEELDLPADFPLDALCVYAVYSDGAYAEGAGAELYRRFMKAPEETLEHIATLLDWNIPCRGTAASNVVFLLAFDAQYFDTVEEGKTPFRDLMKRLRVEYPDGGEAQVLDLLEEELKRMEEHA